MNEVNSDIFERSKHDVVIHKGLQVYKHGGISYQQALEMIVLHLSKSNEELTNKLVKKNSNKHSNIIFI